MKVGVDITGRIREFAIEFKGCFWFTLLLFPVKDTYSTYMHSVVVPASPYIQYVLDSTAHESESRYKIFTSPLETGTFLSFCMVMVTEYSEYIRIEISSSQEAKHR